MRQVYEIPPPPSFMIKKVMDQNVNGRTDKQRISGDGYITLRLHYFTFQVQNEDGLNAC